MKKIFLLLIILSILMISCSEPPANVAPAVIQVSTSKSQVALGEQISLEALCYDADGDTISYSWSATGGTLGSSSSIPTTWIAPNIAGDYTITLTITDGRGNSDNASVQINVQALNQPARNLVIMNSDTGLLLRWTNPTSPDFSSIRLLRKAGSYPEHENDGDILSEGTSDSCTDEEAQANVLYCYSLYAKNQSGEFSKPLRSRASLNDDIWGPEVSNVTSSVTNNQFNLNWDNPEARDFNGIIIVKKEGEYPAYPGDGEMVQILNGTETWFNDTELYNQINYYYSFYAFDYSYNYALNKRYQVTLPDTIVEDDSIDPIPTPPSSQSGDPTEHSGTISTDEVWYPADNPHVITGNLKIAGDPPGGATLTITAGCEVKFNQGCYIETGDDSQIGKIIAQGTESQPILFTSNQVSKSAGWWEAIYLNDADGGSSFTYCDFEYGGGSALYEGMLQWKSGPSISITHCSFSNSAARAVYFRDSTASGTLDNCTFTGNTGFAIEGKLGNCQVIGSGNSFSANLAAVKLNNSVLESGTVNLHAFEQPWICDSLNINGPANLNIAAGAQLNMAAGTGITLQNGGSMISSGTEGAPVLITSNQAEGSKTPGFWGNIHIESTAGICDLDYTTIEYGSDGIYPAIIRISSTSNVSLDNCTVKGSLENGLEITSSASAATGISINQCQFVENNDYGMEIYANNMAGIAASNSFNGNGKAAILFKSTSQTVDVTWPAFEQAYRVGSYTVEGEEGPCLTIEAGARIEFLTAGKMEIGRTSNPGQIIAEGTSANPIIFTGSVELAGHWDYVYLGDKLAASRLTYCQFSYGGEDSTINNTDAMLIVNGSSPDIINCSISDSDQYGLNLIDGANPDITDTAFSNNTTYDIYIDGTSSYTGTPSGSPTSN